MWSRRGSGAGFGICEPRFMRVSNAVVANFLCSCGPSVHTARAHLTRKTSLLRAVGNEGDLQRRQIAFSRFRPASVATYLAYPRSMNAECLGNYISFMFVNARKS